MEYWINRNLEVQTALLDKSIDETNEQVRKYFQKAMKSVTEDFEETYLTLLKDFVSEDKQPTPADLYKLDKYWQSQNQLAAELTKLGDKQAELLHKQFVNSYINFYTAIAIPSQSAFSTVDVEIVEKLVENIWCADKKSWSDRVWDNTERLKQTLNDNLVSCVVAGKKPSQLKKILQEDFQVSYHRADTLVRTEMAHIQTEASRNRYKDAGCVEVEVLADKDERRCEICGKLHKQRFPIDGVMPVPAHPNCRCTIVPVFEDKK